MPFNPYESQRYFDLPRPPLPPLALPPRAGFSVEDLEDIRGMKEEAERAGRIQAEYFSNMDWLGKPHRTKEEMWEANAAFEESNGRDSCQRMLNSG